MTTDQRIRNGIALLDAHGPFNWRQKITAAIRAKRFSICSPKHCVLGEIYGDYEIGLDQLGMKDYGSQYGFMEDYHIPGDYELLTHGWIQLYQKGKAAAKKTRRRR